MRALRRNRRPFYYSNLLKGGEPVFDESGNEIGKDTAYTEPKKAKANISAGRGSADESLFGVNSDHSRTILVEPAWGIDVTSLLWIGIEPMVENGIATVRHNYVVTAIADSLNDMLAAVNKVT